MDRVIHEASTVQEANTMFRIKSVIYSQKVITFPEGVSHHLEKICKDLFEDGESN